MTDLRVEDAPPGARCCGSLHQEQYQDARIPGAARASRRQPKDSQLSETRGSLGHGRLALSRKEPP